MSNKASPLSFLSGYELHEAYVRIDAQQDGLVKLFVPRSVKAAIDAETQQAHDLLRTQQEERAQRKFQERDAKIKSDADQAADASNSVDAALVETDQAAPLKPDPLITSPRHTPQTLRAVHAPDAPAKLQAKATALSHDKDLRKRDEEVAKRLKGLGHLRLMAAPDSAEESLNALRHRQPNFGAVIDLVRDHLLLAACSSKGMRLPPMLLNGEPGVGKTYFAFELAKALGTTVRRVAFDSPISGATLMGSERRWSNTQYGAVFELVCLGPNANPVFVLDEIDKAGSRRDWDPLAPLHTLLEPLTASSVRDISLDFEFDASRVTWIATSNQIKRIPESLLSRFQIFEIERPNAEAAIRSALSVVQATFEELALDEFEQPDKDLAVRLAHLTAREIQQAAQQAIARAVAQGRSLVTLADLPDWVREGEEDGGATKRRSPRSSKDWLH